MKRWAWTLVALWLPLLSFGQEEENQSEKFTFSGFLDLYYGYDFNEPTSEKRFDFLYNHTRHHKPSVNLALVSASYQSDRFRANLGLQQGSYVQDNYAAEPKALRWINEANLGLALDAEGKVWLDAGVLPSHIGFESAVSKDNLTLSRSLIAENSPYFETGIRLGWEKSEQWYFALLYLNGWQRIQAIPGKNKPSFGTQATFSPTENTTLNWSTFLGTDQSIEAQTSIYFSNMYGTFSLGERWKVIGGLDVGKRVTEGTSDRNWWGIALIAQYRLSERLFSGIRYEYFDDPFQGISVATFDGGLEAGGFSLNLDRRFGDWGWLRLEGRWLDSQVPIYQGTTPAKAEDFFLLASLAVSLD